MAPNELADYNITGIKPGVWCIEDADGNSSYLIAGSEKALLIDTGWGATGIRAVVESLTGLPVECALTHGHADHIFHANEFDGIDLHPEDQAILHTIYQRYPDRMAGHEVDLAKTQAIQDGDVLDLGGGTIIQVVGIGGHTPGSVAFVDAKHAIVFTGDAIGSGLGVWLQIPNSLTVRQYRANLQYFLDRLDSFGPLLFLGGHRSQAGRPGSAHYNPLCRELVLDMISLCDGLISASPAISEKEFKHRRYGTEQPYKAYYHRAQMVYLKSQIG